MLVLDFDELLRSPHDHQLVKGVRERIFAIRDTKGPFASYVDRLSPGERLLLIVGGFIWELDNGGFNQVLVNSIGDFAEELRSALRRLGATEVADALDAVSATVFKGPIPVDQAERTRVLWAWEEQDETRAEDFFDSLGGETDPIVSALARYIRENLPLFE